MATFTVHVPPGVIDALRRADRTIFVREGFSLPAFLFGPLFFLYRRLWLAALCWCAAAALLALLARALGLPADSIFWLFLLLAVLTGLEAHEARRVALARRGFILAAILAGVTREEGERLFFGAVPAPLPHVGSGSANQSQAPGEPDVIGMFPRVGDAP